MIKCHCEHVTLKVLDEYLESRRRRTHQNAPTKHISSVSKKPTKFAILFAMSFYLFLSVEAKPLVMATTSFEEQTNSPFNQLLVEENLSESKLSNDSVEHIPVSTDQSNGQIAAVSQTRGGDKETDEKNG